MGYDACSVSKADQKYAINISRSTDLDLIENLNTCRKKSFFILYVMYFIEQATTEIVTVGILRWGGCSRRTPMDKNFFNFMGIFHKMFEIYYFCTPI